MRWAFLPESAFCSEVLWYICPKADQKLPESSPSKWLSGIWRSPRRASQHRNNKQLTWFQVSYADPEREYKAFQFQLSLGCFRLAIWIYSASKTTKLLFVISELLSQAPTMAPLRLISTSYCTVRVQSVRQQRNSINRECIANDGLYNNRPLCPTGNRWISLYAAYAFAPRPQGPHCLLFV